MILSYHAVPTEEEMFFIGSALECSFPILWRFPIKVNIIRAWDYPKIAACPDSGYNGDVPLRSIF